MVDFTFFNLTLVIQIFVLLNPLSSFPILMSAHAKKMDVKKIAFGSVMTAFVVAIVIALIGPLLFNLFGVSIDSFRIAGGVVLLLLGLSTIRPPENEHKHTSGFESTISIIATPMLTGPATISFIAIKTAEVGLTHLLLNIITAFILVGILFIAFAYMVDKINPNLIDITSRVLGLFLTAVAIEMMANGIGGLIKSMA